MSYSKKDKVYRYIDFKTNGRLFPTWILANFSKYKLPEIFLDNSDPCNNKKISSNTFNDTFDKIQDIENQVSTLGYEEMMQKQNIVFAKMLKDKENIKALKYFNTKDAGMTWRDLENQNFSNNVEPDFSYMVLDPSIIKKDK